MSINFLTGSNGNTISLVSFDPAAKTINVVKNDSSFTTPSWIEPSAKKDLKGKVYYASQKSKVFYTVSEANGKVVSLELQSDGTLKVTGSAPTGGNPAHVHAIKDGSGLIATNYMGGSAVFIPIDPETGAISAAPSIAQTVLSAVTVNTGSVSPILKFTSPYGSSTGPNSERQEASHPHQCIEGNNQDFYVPDLGSDRVWQLKRKGVNELEVTAEIYARAGSGPRHAAVHSNGKYLYLVTELAHEVFIYPTPQNGSKSTALYPTGPCITPKEIPRDAAVDMTAGELILNHKNDRVLYVSNRGQVDLNEKLGANAVGDAVAVITLNAEGDDITNVDIISTEINFIRGMKLSPCGKYLGLVGQKDGKVAIYETSGEFGEKITLVAKSDAGLDEPTDITWIE